MRNTMNPVLLADSATIGPPAKPPRRLGRRFLFVGAVAVATIELFIGRDWLASSAQALTSASLPWIAVAAACAVASMASFGAVRSVTLGAGGVRMPILEATSISYAAGAIHSTLPGGAVFSTAYAFRTLKSRGASAAVATWSLAISGVLAATTLAVVGMAGVLLAAGATNSIGQLVVEILCASVILGCVMLATRYPEALLPIVEVVARGVNRMRGKPAAHDMGGVRVVVADLAAIQPTPGRLAAAGLLSLLNWLFDVACLASCTVAVGLHISLPALLLTYTAGMAVVSLSPLPAGLGVVEGAMAVGLTAAGAPAAAAIAAVLIYRLLSVGGTVAAGWSILGGQVWRHRA